MTELEIHEYREYDRFVQEWEADDVATKLVWQLLGQLEDDELLIQLPEWLADQKGGFVGGAVSTEFVGRIDRETDDAILFSDAAAVPSLL